MKLLGTWTALFVVGLAASGCNKVGATDQEAASSPAKQDEVLGLYVQCFNKVSASASMSFERYASWVDLKTGPTNEASVGTVYAIDDYQTKVCLENLAKAPTTGELAAPTKAYAASLSALVPLVLEAKTYYEQKDYKDDAFAKGKQLHGTLVAAFEAYESAEAALRTVWDGMNAASRDRVLAEVEKTSGRKSEVFVTRLVMSVSEQLIEVVLDEAATSASITAAIDRYKAAHGEMATFFGPTLTASTDTDRYMFKKSSDELMVQVKEAARALAATQALPESGDGSAEAVLEAYNRLVDTSNSITWD